MCKKCEEQHHNHHDKSGEDCVCEVVKKIHRAQEEAENSACDVSCERSIDQLLSPAATRPMANTVPFLLNCSRDTFFGKAAVYNHHDKFCVISSPFFKVKKIDKDCCAVLELLWPTCNDEPFEGNLNEFGGKHGIPCFEFDGFLGTGACINVDLKCFCSISCFRATWVQKATPSQIHDIF